MNGGRKGRDRQRERPGEYGDNRSISNVEKLQTVVQSTKTHKHSFPGTLKETDLSFPPLSLPLAPPHLYDSLLSLYPPPLLLDVNHINDEHPCTRSESGPVWLSVSVQRQSHQDEDFRTTRVK